MGNRRHDAIMRYRAMTLSETLIAGAVVGLLLLVVALGVSWIRQELKDRQAQTLLEMLDEALAVYHAETGAWPTGRHPAETQPAAWLGDEPSGPADGDDWQNPFEREADQTARRVIGQLASVPEARKILQKVPPLLRGSPENTDEPDGDSEWDVVRDPWGTPLRCLTVDSASPADQQAVAANGGRPIFESAGPDRRFGMTDPADQADNRMLMPSPR